MEHLKKIFFKLLSYKLIILFTLFYALIFISIYGYHILNPFYTDWLLYKNTKLDYDLFVNHMEFLAFINAKEMIPYTELYSFPFKIGALYGDIAPLLAIITKLFILVFNNIHNSFIEFSYSGIMGLINFILMGLFSFYILSKTTKASKITLFVCSLFFVFSPILIERFPRNHTLTAQWLILASFLPFILKNLFNKTKILFSLIIGFISSGIHLYFVPIIFINIFAYALYSLIKERNIKFSVLYTSSFILGAFISFIMSGGIPIQSFSSGDDIRIYSANLLTFIQPNASLYPSKSIVFPFLNNIPTYQAYGQHEGYAYLGAGIILLLLFGLLLYCNKMLMRNHINIKEHKIEIFTFSLIFFISLICSLSPDITLGNNLVISIPLPENIEYILGTFRVTGRYIWNNFYLIYLIIFICILNNLKEKFTFPILILCLFIQLIDISPLIISLNNDFAHKLIYKSELSEMMWKDIITKNNKKILLTDNSKRAYVDYIYLDYFALTNNIKYNTIIYSRKAKYEESFYQDRLENPHDEDLFIFYNEKGKIDFIKEETTLHNCYFLDKFIICSKNELVNDELKISKININRD